MCTFAEGDGFDDVAMSERLHFITSQGVPQLGAEVGRPCHRLRRFDVQSGTPHRPLVSYESADPVATGAVPQHRLVV